MADGNNGSPYRRSAHYGAGGGHFSPMHTTSGASSGGASNFYADDTTTGDGGGNPYSNDQSLWDDFESVACSVTDLYRNPSWNVFQRTASATTQFYKGSVEASRRGVDTGITIGRHILCKEIIHWLQTSNSSHTPFVRRDEIINFILTKAVLPSTNESSSGSTTMNPAGDFGNSSPMQTQHQDSSLSSVRAGHHHEEPLEIFQEALAMPPPTTRQNFAAAAANNNPSNNVGLTAFFVEECRRHANGKRRRLSPDHNPYYFHSNNSPDLSPDGSGNGNYWHAARPAKRSRRF